jgi:putative FmdB family regulatory protein
VPIYSYQCLTHGEFILLKAVSSRNEATYCPDCNGLATRSITAPNLSVMSDSNRKAWQRNEKSMHEPKRISRKHTCSHEHSNSTAHTTPLKAAQKNTRPWMLGH